MNTQGDPPREQRVLHEAKTTFLCNMQLFKGLQGLLTPQRQGLGPFVDTRPSQANRQQGARLHSYQGGPEEAPAQPLPGATWAMGPRSQLSGDHGQLEALCHANTSVLAPGGHELFWEAQLTFSPWAWGGGGAAVGAPDVSLRPSLWEETAISPLTKALQSVTWTSEWEEGSCPAPQQPPPSCSCSRAQKM